MKLLLVLTVAVVSVVAAIPTPVQKPSHLLSGKELVDYINGHGKWRARLHPRFESQTAAELQTLLGTYNRPLEKVLQNAAPEPVFKTLNTMQLPREFNAATAWPKCSKLISSIVDQSSCGSCWAVSTTSSMQDRMCIASDGAIQTQLSSWDLLECCADCGQQCHGGYPDEAFVFMRARGLVSGSNYTEAKGCKPYPLKPCHLDKEKGHAVCPDAPTEPYFKCKRECQDGYTDRKYALDKYYGGAYHLFNQKPEEAMVNLMEHGPLVASFHVYEDFYHYDGGVYEHIGGRFLGGHAVRVVGWGEENGTPYWLVANSWHDYWGEGGLFRIRRGNNECEFEERLLGGLADIERSPKN